MRPSIPAFAATDPDIYERFMGRWSARMADPFLSFAGVESGQRVLDVGCGTGIITLASRILRERLIGARFRHTAPTLDDRGESAEPADYWHCLLLRAEVARRGHRAAQPEYKVAELHSFTCWHEQGLLMG